MDKICCKNVYQNAICLNDDLQVELNVDFRLNKNENTDLLEKCKEYKQYYLDRNCGLDLKKDDYIKQIKGIINIANEKKSLLDDVHKHMLEQIEEVL